MMHNSYPAYFHTQDGTRIFYTTNFKKLDKKDQVIVFNYGLMCNNAHFKDQIEFFDRHGYKIIFHDYRAHFNSSGQNEIEKCTFHNMVNDLHQILLSLGVTKSHMIGHSMGVNVTLEYARQFPSFLKSMVLISGSVLPPQDIMFDTNLVDVFAPLLEAFANAYPEYFEKGWKNGYKNPVARMLVHRGGFNTAKVRDSFVQLYMKKISELPKEIIFHLLSIMKNHDIINVLEEIRTPSLIIGGDNDKIIPNYLQRILTSYLQNSQLYIIKNGSHVPQADFPEFINSRMLLFFKR